MIDYFHNNITRITLWGLAVIVWVGLIVGLTSFLIDWTGTIHTGSTEECRISEGAK